MNASKTLIAAIAAATIVGTVGFVSAQTTDTSTPAAQRDTPMKNPTAPTDMSSPGYVAPAAGTTAAGDAATPAAAQPSGDTTMPATEPAPKADRN